VAEDTGDVSYRRILEAVVTREFLSINGIFPKIVRISLLFNVCVSVESKGAHLEADRGAKEEGR